MLWAELCCQDGKEEQRSGLGAAPESVATVPWRAARAAAALLQAGSWAGRGKVADRASGLQLEAQQSFGSFRVVEQRGCGSITPPAWDAQGVPRGEAGSAGLSAPAVRESFSREMSKKVSGCRRGCD